MTMTTGYINTPVLQEHFIKVDNTHTLYVEECGNPNGQPVIFLHGGPGGCVSEFSRRFFDPNYYRIIAVDQRGCGKSTPFLSIENNTVLHSAHDLETIRKHLKIDSWIVFGGSYGSTLALVYAIHYPNNVERLVLRGIFLGRDSDTQWLFQEGTSYFYPEEFDRFKSFIPKEAQHDLVNAYYKRMLSEDKALREAAYKSWADWEGSVIKLVKEPVNTDVISPVDRTLGLFEAHYFANKMFWGEDDYILNRVEKIQHIPTDIYHGRYDVDCRLSGAYELAAKLPHSQLHIVESSGHSPSDPPLFDALLDCMERLKQ